MTEIISLLSYKVPMFSFFAYYAYMMNDTRIYAIDFSTKKDLKIRKWRNNFLMLMLIFFWSYGWYLTPEKPALVSTMKAELFFLVGYFVIYYIINAVTREINNKDHIIRCENKVLILLAALGGFLFFAKTVDATILYMTVYFIVTQIILKIFMIQKFKYLKIKKGLYILYITFFILSIINNFMNLIYLYDVNLFYFYSKIRVVWEFVIGIWSIWGILTIKKARSVI